MEWQEPKTDWHSKSQPLPLDFNRIEGNIRELKNEIELMNKRPLARVKLNSPFSAPVGSLVKIPFDSISIDTNGYYDRSKYQYIPPAGYYRVSISLNAYLSETDSITQITLQLARGNAAYYTTFEFIINIGTAGPIEQIITLSDIVRVDGTQAIDFRIAAYPLASPLGSCVATFEKVRDV